MVLRRRLNLPRDLFPIDPWTIETRAFTGEFAQEAETIFALSNGYLGLRGTHDEDYPVYEAGTYLNGFYELRPLVYGEEAYGLPKTGQSMLNCPDGTIVKLYVDDEPFDVESRELRVYRRRLDMRRACLTRELVWATPSGKDVHIKTTRFVSLSHRHLAVIAYEVRPENAACDVTLASRLVSRTPMELSTNDPRDGYSLFGDRVLRPQGYEGGGTRAILMFDTAASRQNLACGMDHQIQSTGEVASSSRVQDHEAEIVLRSRVPAGETLRLVKFIAYHASGHRELADLRHQVVWTLENALESGLDRLAELQIKDAKDFWDWSDVTIAGSEERQQQVRWNLFQLMQASWSVDGSSIGARGLTGQSYEGHYFWDTEIYVLPFLAYTNPRIARNILRFRYDKLDAARRRAREVGHRGCLYPWRTINGDEASAYFAASTAQYHINADIMYAMRKYVDVTGDEEFLCEYGAEMLVETARLWVDLGHYTDRNGGQFCISGVTGPDEYTAIVNNNYFTNLMARENLRYATEVVRMLEAGFPSAFAGLLRKTGLEPDEPAAWQQAAERMFLPYDDRLGIHPQDDSFLDKPAWDFAATPAEHYPLLLYYHPLVLYRHQVIKQADTLLAMVLLRDEFGHEERKRNFDYYDPLTTHDSSLSVCIQSIVANDVGYAARALDYFNFALTMDLSDVGGNVRNGAHVASIGGTWLALVYGFGGLNDQRGLIRFRPKIPREWACLSFRLRIRGNRLVVEAYPDRTKYHLLDGAGVTFRHFDEEVRLDPADRHRELPNARPDGQACGGGGRRSGRPDPA